MNTIDEIPDPFGSKEQMKPGQPNTTRLVEIGYKCHLCGNEHGAEYYITASKADMETMLDQLSRGERSDYLEDFLGNEGFQNSVKIMAQRTHGDLEGPRTTSPKIQRHNPKATPDLYPNHRNPGDPIHLPVLRPNLRVHRTPQAPPGP